MRIILIGIQGSGKSTQGKLLVAHIGVPYLSTGDIFRSLASQNSPEGRWIKERINAGVLIPDTEVIPLIAHYLTQDEFAKGYILDGFPRTLAQAQAFTQTINHVIYLHLSDEEALRRIAGRKDSREDETQNAIKKRIETFHTQTKPVIQYYRGKDLLREVNGEQTKEQVFSDVQKVL